jgi:hypothetical protein
LGIPAPRCEIRQREFDTGVDLLCGHAWRQSWIRKIHRGRIKTDQYDAFHRPSSPLAIACSNGMDQPEADDNHHRTGYAMNGERSRLRPAGPQNN